MQRLNVSIVRSAKRFQLQTLEKELREGFEGSMNKERCECPFCHYTSKKNKHSGVVFVNGNEKTFKCFSCGIWRRIE